MYGLSKMIIRVTHNDIYFFFKKYSLNSSDLHNFKLPDIVQIQVCRKHGPRGSDGATMGKTILTVSILENSPELEGQFQSNFIQIILA
jgi:hypothetical protein